MKGTSLGLGLSPTINHSQDFPCTSIVPFDGFFKMVGNSLVITEKGALAISLNEGDFLV